MATLLLTAVGTALGGPIGGALGALIGQQVDAAVFAPPGQKGPRLKDLSVQSSSYGAPIPRHYGRMRVAGSVIWATELVENREKSGGGKGRPKTVTYSYSSSFAVALASRPILGVGRIWADGNLLRGAEGDLKAAGSLRVHLGHGDQAPDPLIAAAEGVGSGAVACPAFRHTAYAVLEDLALADFGNRIPSLTFEVIADDGTVSLAELLADALPGVGIAPLDGVVAGYSVDSGTAGDLVESLAALYPLAVTVETGAVRIAPAENPSAAAPVLPEPVPARGEGQPGGPSGFARQRERATIRREAAVRYYDTARDYQPGIQRGRGRSQPGQARTIDFPAALDAATARALADAVARRSGNPRETATYRIAEIDPRYAAGRIVRIGGDPARWLVEDWEWRSDGIELGLRVLPAASGAGSAATDPGRANLPPDLPASPTQLAALELPWDGIGTGAAPALYAAVSSAGAGWNGAALFAEVPGGGLVALGPSGRQRATIGRTVTALAPAPPHLLDRATAFEVELAGADLTLTDATLAQLAMGANRAVVGGELIQFANAQPLGDGRWRLGTLLRGRGGTEAGIHGHAADEPFVLIDEDLVALDPALVGDAAMARIAALGLIDPAPVLAPFLLAGATRRPLSPVHGKLSAASDGVLTLRWTRRARGALLWPDAVETPLGEASEAYAIALGDAASPAAQWETSEPRLEIAAALAAQLRLAAPGGWFAVRQRGDAGLSAPLAIGPLA